MDALPTDMATADTGALPHAFHQRVLWALPTQLAVYSPQGVFEFVTPSAIADAATRAWIIGRNDHEYAERRGLPAEIPNRRRQLIETVVRTGEAVTFEEQFATRQGEMRWFRRYLTPVKDAEGQVQHVIGYGIDITEQRRAEDQLRQAQKMEAVGRLAGGVAHDFNNLITIIGGFAETLEDAFAATDARHEAVSSIREAADRASGLTRQLLSFSRRAPLELTTFDAHAVVNDTIQLLDRVISEKIRVTLSLCAHRHDLHADAGQFKQVLLNLIVNARDAMPNGGELRITSRVTKRAPNGNRSSSASRSSTPPEFLELEVADTGTGMSPDTMARVFEPFFTTKPPEKGTGLGLSTVYGIVSQLGGYVTVNSTLGRGSTFHISLPLAETSCSEQSPQPVGVASAQGTATILVAEDEQGVRLLIVRILRSRGYHVLEAASGSEALAVLEAYDGTIDVLVTDVVMSDFGGRTLADAARVLRPALRVLYVSGYADEDNLLDADNPAESFLEKPFTVDALAQRVHTLRQVSARGSSGVSSPA